MTGYPDTMPGWKGPSDGPGADAARAFSSQLGRRQREVLEALGAESLNAEGISERTGRHWYVVRPRLSELERLGLVVKTGERGRSAFGGKSTIYRRSTPAGYAAHVARKTIEEKGEGDNV